MRARLLQLTPTPVRTALRHLRGAALTLYARVITPIRLRQKDFRTPTRIHLGCGPRILPGWINTDSSINRTGGILYVNLAKPLPFPGDVAAFVFSEHVHEHLPYKDGLQLLREVYRVLAPSGVLRLAVPNLDFYLRLHTEKNHHDQFIREWHQMAKPDAPADALTMINDVFMNYGHRYIYDFDGLRRQLESAGFRNIREFEPGKSDVADLANLETNPLMRGNTLALHIAYTLCVEATK